MKNNKDIQPDLTYKCNADIYNKINEEKEKKYDQEYIDK